MKQATKPASKRSAAIFILYCVLFALCAALILWKCRYGFANIDESFYLTVPYRLLQGDALFSQEWHLSQMSGWLLYPFVSLYVRASGSTDGILLAARYLFTACNLAASIFVFCRFRRYHLLGAAAASLCLLLFAPYGVMALSYNSIGILCLILAFTLLMTGNGRRLDSLLAGILFAFAVLCNPYLLVLYALAVLAYFALYLPVGPFRTARMRSIRGICGKHLLLFTLGAAVIAAGFLVFVFSRASLAEILRALPWMLDDPEHPPIPFIEKLISYLYHSIVVNRYTKFSYFGLGIFAVLCLFDKKRKQHKGFYFAGVSVCTAFLLFAIWLRNHTLNYLLWPLNCFAPFILLLSERKENRRIFSFLWVPGMLYSFCMHLSSNQKFYAISSASIVALMGSLLMIAIFAEEVLSDRPNRLYTVGIYALLTVLFAGLLGSEAYERYVGIFWDTSIENQTCLIEDGIDRGIYVSEGLYEEYYEDLSIVRGVEQAVPNADRVLFFAYKPQYYLMTDRRTGSYSPWLSMITPATVSRLHAFYEMQPELLPDAIFVGDEHADCVDPLCETLGYAEIPFKFGILLIRQ